MVSISLFIAIWNRWQCVICRLVYNKGPYEYKKLSWYWIIWTKNRGHQIKINTVQLLSVVLLYRESWMHLHKFIMKLKYVYLIPLIEICRLWYGEKHATSEEFYIVHLYMLMYYRWKEFGNKDVLILMIFMSNCSWTESLDVFIHFLYPYTCPPQKPWYFTVGFILL